MFAVDLGEGVQSFLHLGIEFVFMVGSGFFSGTWYLNFLDYIFSKIKIAPIIGKLYIVNLTFFSSDFLNLTSNISE